MDRLQTVIDFVMRNRRPIGGCILVVGLGLHAVTACDWCRSVAEFCAVAGAWITGTGSDSSDRKSEIKQALRDGAITDRRTE